MDVALVISPRETSGGGVHCPSAVIFSCFLPYVWNSNSSAGKRSNSTHARILPFPSPPTYISPPRTHMLALLCCRSFFDARRCYVCSYCTLQHYSREMLVSLSSNELAVYGVRIVGSSPQEKQNNIRSFHFVCHDLQSQHTSIMNLGLIAIYDTVRLFFVVTPWWSCTLSIIQSMSESDSLHTGHYLSRIHEWQVTNRSVFEGLLSVTTFGCPLSEEHVYETIHCPLFEECLVCIVICMYNAYYLRHFRMRCSAHCPIFVCEGQRMSFQKSDSLRYSVNKFSAGCTVHWITRAKQNHMNVSSGRHAICCDSCSNSYTRHNPEDSKLYINRWVKRDQLNVTCFIISLCNAQHVSDVNTSILRSLWLMCWVITWVALIWFDVCWCYVVVWLWWCDIRMQAVIK